MNFKEYILKCTSPPKKIKLVLNKKAMTMIFFKKVLLNVNSEMMKDWFSFLNFFSQGKI